jgi:hypothetical protein
MSMICYSVGFTPGKKHVHQDGFGALSIADSSELDEKIQGPSLLPAVHFSNLAILG